MSPNPAAAAAIPELSKSDLGRCCCLYSTREARGLSADARRGPCTARPSRRPTSPLPASAGGAHPRRRAAGHPELPGAALDRLPRLASRPAVQAARLPVTCGRREEAGGSAPSWPAAGSDAQTPAPPPTVTPEDPAPAALRGPGSGSTAGPSVPPTPPPRREPGTELERPHRCCEGAGPG